MFELCEEIGFCRVTCPWCGRESFVKNWEPGKCPWCNQSLRGFTNIDLRATDVFYIVTIDRFTGQAAVAPDTA